MPDIDLSDLMQNTGLHPTQKQVYADNLAEYAQAMRQASGTPGAWDWNKTANDLRPPMVKDAAGNILAGHHRFIAVELAGIAMPDGVVRTKLTPTLRMPRSWDSVVVSPGLRP